MSVTEIVGLCILGVILLILSLRYGFFELFIDIIFAILGGGGGSSGSGSSFGGGSFGGGGSSSDD